MAILVSLSWNFERKSFSTIPPFETKRYSTLFKNGGGNDYLFFSHKNGHSDKSGPLHGDYKAKHKGHANSFLN